MVPPSYGYVIQMYHRNNSVVSLYYIVPMREFTADGREEIQAYNTVACKQP
jgi:hypothetical protein